MPPRELVADLHAAGDGDRDVYDLPHRPAAHVADEPAAVFAGVHDAAPRIGRNANVLYPGPYLSLVALPRLFKHLVREEDVALLHPRALAHDAPVQVDRGRLICLVKEVNHSLALFQFAANLFHVDGSEDVLANAALGNHDGVLVVVALEGDVGHHDVLADGHVAAGDAGALPQHLARADAGARAHRAGVVPQRVLLGSGGVHEAGGVHL
mmetsp:Transcript_101328/g.295130  ORF Transcript_101328/g.295130 Transcript_101328/m.295130 type:complete len:210 (-) Transcript_101328:114-743(-)